MAFRYLIYSTGTTYATTIVRESATNNPGVNEASLYSDFVIPEIQPLYLWRITGGVNVVPNTESNINLYEASIAGPPQPQDNINYGQVTGITNTKIDKVTGVSGKVPVFTAGGGLQSGGYTVAELTGKTTYTFQGSGGTTVTPMGGNLFRFFSTPPTGTTVDWSTGVFNKPSWLSGTTIQAFQTGHTHAQYALKTAAITGATNLGSGNGSIFTTVSANKVQLKTLSGGTNITITCNGNYIGINATTSGTLSWTGNTANGVGTYVSASKICSQPNMTFDGTTLSVPVLNASTSVCSPIISGSTKVCSPIVVGTSCVTSPIICASSCVRSPLLSGQTICATSSAFAPTPAANNNSTCVATTAWYFGKSGNTAPVMDGSALIGTSLKWAHADHVHPSDTSRVTKVTGSTGNIVTFGAAGAIQDSAKTFINTVQSVGVATNAFVPTELAVRNAINQALTAVVILQGDWNAKTNTPNLTGATGITTGFAWRVSASGTTNLGGITYWQIGDLAIKSASGWIRTVSQDISAVWGNIVGTLSGQTDLWNVLQGKQATITGAATTITATDLTTNRAVISNNIGKIAVSPVSSTELSYLTGASSNIQTQLNSKLNTSVFTGYTASTKNANKKIQVVSTSTIDVNVSIATGVTWTSASPHATDIYGWTGTTLKILSAGTYEVQYHAILKNSGSNQTHSIGGYIVKTTGVTSSTLPNTATAAMIVGADNSGELSLPPVIQTFAVNDKLVLALFRIGNAGTVNLVANSTTLTLNKLT